MSTTDDMDLSEIRHIRFDGPMMAAVRRLAAREGLSFSAWLRRAIRAEIARRDDRCPACGAPKPPVETTPT